MTRYANMLSKGEFQKCVGQLAKLRAAGAFHPAQLDRHKLLLYHIILLSGQGAAKLRVDLAPQLREIWGGFRAVTKRDRGRTITLTLTV